MNAIFFGLGLGKIVGGTRIFVNVPPNDAPQLANGTLFSADLLCTAYNPDEEFEPGLFELLRHTPIAANSDFMWVTTGCRVFQHLYLFPIPVLPAGHATMRFTVPIGVVRFFPANQGSLPLSH